MRAILLNMVAAIVSAGGAGFCAGIAWERWRDQRHPE